MRKWIWASRFVLLFLVLEILLTMFLLLYTYPNEREGLTAFISRILGVVFIIFDIITFFAYVHVKNQKASGIYLLIILAIMILFLVNMIVPYTAFFAAAIVVAGIIVYQVFCFIQKKTNH